MAKTTPIRLAAFGLDERSGRALRLLVDGPGNRLAKLADESDAQAMIVDLESEDAESFLTDQKRRHPSRTIIGLAYADPRRTDLYFSSKPVHIPALLDLLKEINGIVLGRDTLPAPPDDLMDALADISAAAEKPAAIPSIVDKAEFDTYVGERKDIDPSDPVEIEKLRYDPMDLLQGHVQALVRVALARKRIVRLDTPWKPVIVLPLSREIWTEADDKQIRSFAVEPVAGNSDDPESPLDSGSNGFRMSVVDSAFRTDMAERGHLQSLEGFIWKIALWGSAGRIPMPLDPRKPVYLNHWPDLTRYVLCPHALNIAALLAERPCTLFEAAEKLNIPQSHVFSFFSAAHALGLADQVPDAGRSECAAAKPVSPSSGTNVLKSLLKRLSW